MTEQYKVLRIDVDGAISYAAITRDYRDIKALLNDGWLEAAPINADDVTLYCDEEGKIKGLPINPVATKVARMFGWLGHGFDSLCGPVVIVGNAWDEEDGTVVADAPERALSYALAAGGTLSLD